MATTLPTPRWSHPSPASSVSARRCLSSFHYQQRSHGGGSRRPKAHGSFSRPGLSCRAIETSIGTPTAAAVDVAKAQKSRYDIENLTTWLLKQEQAGHIDAELTIVLSSISLACKQIAALLQRSNIINLARAHGTINIQGEDQKKLDVISNELPEIQRPDRDYSI